MRDYVHERYLCKDMRTLLFVKTHAHLRNILKQIYYKKNDVHSTLKWKRHQRHEHNHTVVKLTRKPRLHFITCGLCVSYKTWPCEEYTWMIYITNCGKPPRKDTRTTENVALGNVFLNMFLVFNNNVNMVNYWCNTLPV